MAIISTELTLVTTVTVLGALSGLAAIRDAGNQEAVDVANAIRAVDPSFSYQGNQISGANGSIASTAGASFQRPTPVPFTMQDSSGSTTPNAASAPAAAPSRRGGRASRAPSSAAALPLTPVSLPPPQD